VATFSKPLNALLAVPLAVGAGPTWRAWARSLMVFAVVVPALFGINALISGGDPNYQGGNRKTFYTRFPYNHPDHLFETSGTSRATDTVAGLPPEVLARSPERPHEVTVGVKTDAACDILVSTHEGRTVSLAAGERRDVALPVDATFLARQLCVCDDGGRQELMA
jgi:hypothetical protein